MQFGRSIPAGLTLLFFATASLDAAPMHPVERRLREAFPSVSVEASATFDAAEEMAGGKVVSGLRARFAQASARPDVPGIPAAVALARRVSETQLQVTWPRYYSDPLVASLGDQRVVLRAVNARDSISEATNGKLIYQESYRSVDAMEVPGTSRSEELLLLRDHDAPLVYDYEIVEMRGVSAVVMDGGAIRFLPDVSEVPGSTQIASGRFTQPPRMLQIDRPWVVDASGRRSEAHAKWTIAGEGKEPKTLRLTVSDARLEYPLVVDPTFSATGSLGTARQYHTATLLPSGKVLIAGGYNGVSYLNSVEIYDPATGTFDAAGRMITARGLHTATLLQNGKVLIAGGYNGATVSSAEMYDPATGTFSATGSMGTVRHVHTATLLPNGKVLVVGGGYTYTSGFAVLNSAEVFDPAGASGIGSFSFTGNLAAARYAHTATLLPSGKVLIAGGHSGSAYLSSAEVFDASGAAGVGSFSPTGSLAGLRALHTATLLPNGKVLVAGGSNGASMRSAELFDPAGAAGVGSFSGTGSLASQRMRHTAALLPNGMVLIVGGQDSGTVYPGAAELYDPAGAAGAGSFSPAGLITTARGNHSSTLLPNGDVLIVGGSNGVEYCSLAELYDPVVASFTSSGNLGTARQSHVARPLPNGKVLIAGGNSGAALNSAELFDPAGAAGVGSFTPTGNLASARNGITATLLPDGKVLVAGGFAELYDPAGASGAGSFGPTGSFAAVQNNHTATLLANGNVLLAGGFSSVVLASAQLYNTTAGTFTSLGSLTLARYGHTATLLQNGKVLIAGGQGSSGGCLVSAELYDPANGTFSATGSLVTPRCRHSATLLPNGKVLIAGGRATGSYYPAGAELYDPASGTFGATGALGTTRWQHTATLLPNGKVLIAGGYNNSYLTSAELYDPAAGTFSNTASLAIPRSNHSATLLPDGKVLVAGGYNGTYLQAAELYDAGFGFAGSRRPTVTSPPASLVQPAAMALSGSGFRGDSEGSGGTMTSSQTNYPLMHLQGVESDQTRFINSDPSLPWSDTNFTSTTLTGLASGHYRLTIFTNAVPSLQSFVSISTAAPGITNFSPSVGPAAGGQSVTITGTNLSFARVTVVGATGPAVVTGSTPTTVTFTTPPHPAGTANFNVVAVGGSVTCCLYTYVAPPSITNINPSIGPSTGGQLITITGTDLSFLTAVTIGGAAASVVSNTATSVTVATPSGTAGAKDVLVTTAGGSVTSTGGYTYVAFGAPTFFSATATSTSQVALNWTAVSGATGYEVWRGTLLNGPYTLVSSPSGTTASDGGLTPNTTYLYKVRAIGTGYPSGFSPIDPATTIAFTDSSLSGVAIKAVHITELRTAVNAMQSAAGQPASTFTDPTLTAGTTIVRRLHVTELRTALDAARSALGLAAISYTDPTITAQSTMMKSAHLTELRIGTQ